ncbi:MAG: hypothetical protein DMF86_02275 [Acidobacteria bacterium]|nr:MAG: hypothetical protein DMF86_02275 [Acidobacteriota bacterium]
MDSLAAGLRLAQYEILEPLGSGGMGEVYRARDARLGREVAIKVMAQHIAADPEMRHRFETEARAVAALSHPNIMGIFELAVVDGVPVAVMELLEGETVRTRLKTGALPWRQAVEIAASVADALAAAHAKGIVHRDLKPENLFLTRDGVVKVLDFGLALRRVAEEAAVAASAATYSPTSPGVVLGTFGYLSPEQALGQTVDGRSDIFSLGCVLYEMLSGRRLFGGSTPQEVVAGLLHDSLPELAGFDPLAPAELRPILVRAVARQPDRRFESARDFAMALRALLTGSAARSSVRSGARVRGKSLAVLPFVNAGADPQSEYLTDGITESIINSLSQLSGLRVVPRSLAFRYKGLQADPATIGLALNARSLLTGRVVQQGEHLNIQAELVDTVTEAQLWGEQFRQKTSDLLAVQEEIAWQISEALRLKLTGAQKKRLKKRATVDPEAYQEFLRGRYHWNTWTPDGFTRAQAHFDRAIAIDPTYAAAWAGLGDTFGVMAYYGFVPPAETYRRARAAALKAIELDRDLADPHVTLAIEQLFNAWNWTEAERSFRKAVRLNPKLAQAQSFYALLHSTLGRHDEAVRQAQLGRSLEPLSPVMNMSVAWALHFAGRMDETIRECHAIEEISPGNHEAGNMLMGCYEATGRFDEAAAIMRRQPSWGLPFDAEAHLAAWQRDGARGYWLEHLAELERLPENVACTRAYGMIHTLTRLGRDDEALDWLERSVRERMGMSVFVNVDPNFEPLRGAPRFQALVRRIGIGN